MSRRTWMIAVSIVAHLALGAGVFISGVWKLERLDGEKPSLGAIGVMMLPEPAGSPPAPAPKVALAKKPARVAKTLTQIEKVEPTAKTPVEATTAGSGSGSGTGSGDGDGSGSGSGNGSGGGCLVPSACAPPTEQKPEPPTAPPLPAMVPPPTLQALFLSGDRKVHPSNQTKQTMLRDGKRQAVATIKTCIGETGRVSSAVLVSSSKYADYDERLLAAVRGWQYRPFLVAGRAMPACGMVTFIYRIE